MNLSAFSYTDAEVGKLDGLISGQIGVLVEEQYRDVVGAALANHVIKFESSACWKGIH